MVVHLGPAVADGVGFSEVGVMGVSLPPWHRISWRRGGRYCRTPWPFYNRRCLLVPQVGLVCVPVIC